MATSTWKEKPYGIPGRIDARAMIYRKDLFERHGVRLPETWDDLRQAAIVMTCREGGQVVQLGYDPFDWDGQFGSQRIIPRVWQNGGEIVTQDGRRPLFNSTEGVDTLRYWTELFTQIAPLEAHLPEVPPRASRLAAGTAAAMLAGQWVLTDAIQAVPDAVPHLLVQPPLRQRRQQHNLFANWFGLGSQSKHPDLAWELLLHFNRAENVLEYARVVGSTLPRKGLPETPYTSDPRYQIKMWSEIVEKYSRPQPLIVNQSGTDPGAALTAAMKAVREGRQSPKESLDEAARYWQEALDGGAREFGL
ncbi:MAG TPA: extracellular solute-binding protein [Chloroflexota bacterium]|nr:extracellular solute-binding protein [Chloroflexota bacterium]